MTLRAARAAAAAGSVPPPACEIAAGFGPYDAARTCAAVELSSRPALLRGPLALAFEIAVPWSARSPRPFWRCTFVYSPGPDLRAPTLSPRSPQAFARVRDALALVPRWLAWRRGAGGAPVSVVMPASGPASPARPAPARPRA